MKQAMTNVDVAALAAELSSLLEGARVDKAYQPAREQVLVRLRQPGIGRVDLLCRLGKFVTPTRKPPANPDQPSMVAKILRQRLGNGRLVHLSQVGFDRLLRLDLERGDGAYAIVFELFGDGNMLLLGENDEILLPMRGEDFAARKLRRGEVYQPPPGSSDPFDLDLEALRARGEQASRDVVRFLALDLGFGPQWAEELCLRAGVAKNTPVGDVRGSGWESLLAAIQGLGRDIRSNDLAPAVVYRDGEPVDAVPFPMQLYPEPEHAYEEAATFREALDTFFVGAVEDEEEDPRQKRFDEAKAKLQRQVDQMEAAIAGFREDEGERRLDGDTLYARFQEVEAILAQLTEARREHSWQEVAKIIEAGRKRGHEAAKMVREIRPHNGTALLRLAPVEGPPRDVEIDLRRSVQENADALYGAGKKAKNRRDGASKALGEARKRLQDLEAKGLDGFGAAPKRAKGRSSHFWFENYRWTVTPSGLVAVGGRSAAQNDAVVKKYLRDGDRYVHAEVHGAPSVVVRPVDGPSMDIPEEDLLVAGQFAACSSRAWRQFGEASAYWVTAAQVSKTPRSGEFVPRGAWIVSGSRNQMPHLPMRWGVALVRFAPNGVPLAAADGTDRPVTKLVGGPPEGLRPFASEVVEMQPGRLDPNAAAARLAEHFGVDVEEAQRALPPGPLEFLGGDLA